MKPKSKRAAQRDHLTPAERSALMAKIKGKHTQPELAMAKVLRRLRIRFRRHRKELPGTPDFVLIDYRTAVFVDGDFWHGRGFDKWGSRLLPFWRKKIGGNIERDKRNFRTLKKRGWHVIRIWEGDLKKNLAMCEAKLLSVKKLCATDAI